jgi:uncharacterized membrane protein
MGNILPAAPLGTTDQMSPDHAAVPLNATVPSALPVRSRDRFLGPTEGEIVSAWNKHPGVRTAADLTTGERAADAMRNGMGSWAFVISALIFLAIWMLYNRNVGFDKYPFILLNLVLSCLAAMQGAILLIAAKRADQVASELASHDYEADCSTREIVTSMNLLLAQNTDLTERVAELTQIVHDHVVSTAT